MLLDPYQLQNAGAPTPQGGIPAGYVNAYRQRVANSTDPGGGNGGQGDPQSSTPGYVPPKGPVPPTAVPGSGGGDGGGFDFVTPPYGGPSSPSNAFWRPAPTLNLPLFNAPTGVDYMNDPGYQFRLNQGEQALQQSAAAQGALRSGATLKDILGYGQNFASSEYQNVFNRDLQGYQANTGARQAMYAPQLQSWQTQMGFGQQDAMAAFERAWDAYTFPITNTTQNAAINASILNANPVV